MRTTVTLDPDVERLLKETARQRRQSFKQVLNNAVRKGLGEAGRRANERPFKVKASPMRLRHELDPARLADLADDQEIQAFREVTRRLARQMPR